MARHKDYEPEDEPAEVLGLDPLATYRPLKQRGPASTLTEPLGLALCRHIAAGRFLRDAAVLAGTNEGVVQGWLRRGREHIDAGEESLYTWFVMEYEGAAAHFRRALEELVLTNIANRQLLEKFIRWRLSLSDPKHYTLPRTAPAAPAADGLFELVKPEEAETSLLAKVRLFLADEEKRLADEEKRKEPPPEPEADDES
ncbi:hypothetical protein [Myxococcus sp. NMCA1]|uniref:hypothetical protein n=1 Tax=Myxococcus sp. NMCA1 TaxID=2996785 RepID=UPI0022858734|nr:hypothetical protein [Myxococcus sp. NMCA1]WAM28520.1 hypothetical protein OZ403_10565 [Myxococcus sp. NMCA1]